jgi:hypothetical protein
MNKKLLLVIIIGIFIINKSINKESNFYFLSKTSYDYFDVEFDNLLKKEEILRTLKSGTILKSLDYNGNLIKNLSIMNVVDFNNFIFIQTRQNHELDKYKDYKICINNLIIQPTSDQCNIKIINFH